MLKTLQVIINIILCFSMICVLTITQIGIFDLMAAQSDHVDGIHISTDNNDEVGYFDAFGFWGTDIKTGIDVGAKYRVRNWFAWKWWKVSMKGVDVAIDFTISLVKPIIVPVAQINAVADYYGKTIDDFYDTLLENNYTNEDSLKDALYEQYYIYGKGYGEPPAILEGYEYSSEKETATRAIIDDVGFETAYARWVKHNKTLYNITWKLQKYNFDNGVRYGAYNTKFIERVDTGYAYIKAPAVVLYYLNLVSIILSVTFVAKYPINLFQARISKKRELTE